MKLTPLTEQEQIDLDEILDEYESEGKNEHVVGAYIERVIANKQAEMVERCALGVEVFAGFEIEAKKILCWRIARAVRALSPDPGFLERKLAEARLEEAKWWKHKIDIQSVGADSALDTEAALLRIAELERKVAFMKAPK